MKIGGGGLLHFKKLDETKTNLGCKNDQGFFSSNVIPASEPAVPPFEWSCIVGRLKCYIKQTFALGSSTHHSLEEDFPVGGFVLSVIVVKTGTIQTAHPAGLKK